MTPQQAKELLPIITAFAEGKTISWHSDIDGLKDLKDNVAFDFIVTKYRIKPEPREWFLAIYKSSLPVAFASYAEANDATPYSIIKVREVLSDENK